MEVAHSGMHKIPTVEVAQVHKTKRQTSFLV